MGGAEGSAALMGVAKSAARRWDSLCVHIGRGPRRVARPFRVRSVLVARFVVVPVVVLTACSSDGDSSSAGQEPRGSPASTSSSTVVEAPAATSSSVPESTVDEVTPALQFLVDVYDMTVMAILADPRVAADQASEEVVNYRQLFVAESGNPDSALEFWASEGARGHFYRSGPVGRMLESTVHAVELVGVDEATFTVCTRRSFVIEDESGSPLSAEAGVAAGSAVAERVGEVWRLRSLSRAPSERCDGYGATR